MSAMKPYAFMLFVLLFASAADPATAQTPLVTCATDRHTVIVDRTPAQRYRYRAWNAPRTPDMRPDLELQNGRREVNGTGVCRNVHYRYTSGDISYVVASPVGCTEDEPPATAVAQLFVFHGEELRTRVWCMR